MGGVFVENNLAERGAGGDGAGDHVLVRPAAVGGVAMRIVAAGGGAADDAGASGEPG